MFKKPKRNFRQRRVRNSESEEEQDDHSKKEEQAESVISSFETKSQNDVAKAKSKTKKKPGSTMLSFGDDEDEEGTFKIKKSSHSKRIAKQIKKESKKEKEERERQERDEAERARRAAEEKEERAKQLQRSQSSDHSDSDKSHSPNGHLSYSDSDDSDSDRKKSLGPFQSVLQTGQIPDAHMIHMARMKRQKAREQQDFIPLEEEEPENAKSRLIREEDHDFSDDEGSSRIKFTVDSREQELKKMHRTLHEAMDEEGSDHENEWEEQQIRKGVNMPNASTAAEGNGNFEQYTYSQSGGLFNSTQGAYNPAAQPPKVDISKTLADMQNLSISDVSKSMKERLEEVTSVYRTHVLERDSMESRFEQCQEHIERCDKEKPRLEKQYKFYQEMKVFVRNIVECLNEKVPQIEYQERCMHHIMKTKTEKFIKRRQEDVKDQADENATIGKAGSAPAVPNPERQRRAAEREARRNRRRRKRESQGILRHDDGMSTDDEENNSEIAKFAAENERILEDSQTIFDDVNEDFYNLSVIKRRFEEWSRVQQESYDEAYIALCLPKLFTPYVKLALIDWNPLEEGCPNFEESEWFENLMFYGCKDREDLKPDDNDIKLIPSIIEKVLLPKLTVLVQTVWDPMSSSQTLKLVRLVQKLLTDYPTVNHESKSTDALMMAIRTRLKKTLDDDVFVPLYPKAVLENKNQGPYLFFQRQFWTCVKLLQNIFRWHGLLSDKTLMELGLDSLLNRYMVLSLMNSPVTNDTIYKCQQVTSTLPKSWFKDLDGNSTLPQLENLCRYLSSAAATLHKGTDGARDVDRKEAREAIKQISKLLVNIHATDHALNLSNQFSFKL